MTQLQKNKLKQERVLKLKKIGFWTLNIVSYILAGLFLIVLIISLSQPKKSNNVHVAFPQYRGSDIQLVEHEENINNVVYDDDAYEIDLSADELENYTWLNLNSVLVNNYTEISFGNTYIYYAGDTLAWEDSFDVNNGYIYFSYRLSGVVVEFNTGYDESFQYTSPNQFHAVLDNVLQTEFDGGITWGLNDEDVYSLIKNAIQLDIQANSEIDIDEDIFTALTSVFTNFITTLNTGVNNVIGLFYDSTNTSLTLLGTLTTIVVGVAVCFFLFRLVIGLIRLRG